MTKRPEDELDGEDDPSTGERPRRRRRAGGLRIPSDNVPRHTGSQPSAPVPEDPGLAVSIAYAFGDDASQPRARIEADLDEPTAIGGRPRTTTAPPFDDFDPDGRTRQMPAVNLEALGLSLDLAEVDDDGGAAHDDGATMPPPMSAADDVDVDLDDDDTGDEPAVVASPVPRHDHHADAGDGVVRVEQQRLHTVALSEDDLEELTDTRARPAELAAPRRFPTTMPPRPATIPPSMSVSGERTTVPMPTLEPSGLGTEVSSVVVSFSSPDSAPITSASPRTPAVPTPAPAFSPGHAPSTVPPPVSAPSTVPPPVNAAPATVPPPVQATPSAASPYVAPATVPPPVQVSPYAASAVPVPVQDEPVAAPHVETLSDGWSLPEPEVSGDAEPIGLAPTTLLEDVVEPVAAPADASDSGEILADELLDDEEHARATPVATVIPSPPSPPTPPPAPTAPVRPPPAPAVTRPPTPPVAARPAPAAEPDDGKKKRRGRPWFEEVFDEDYLRTLPYLTPSATQAEAQLVLESLDLGMGASVLDLGCGYGRHAMELAARGLHVVGVDLSLPLLLRGADEAQRRGLDINFIHADMREIDFDAQFDGAYCLFSTFGYFDDDTNKKVATHIGRALKPGGRLVLQVLNRDYVIGDLPTRVWWEGDGCVVLEEVDFNYFSSRVQSKRSVVFDDGRQVEQEISIRAYSLHELGKLLHAAGLRVVEVSGGMVHRGRFLGNRSREIIVIADRPDKP